MSEGAANILMILAFLVGVVTGHVDAACYGAAGFSIGRLTRRIIRKFRGESNG